MMKILNKKLKMIVSLLTLIFLVVSTITLSACGTTNETSTEESGNVASTSASFRTLDEIKADGTIKVGVYKDDSVQQSFDEAVAEKIAESLGVKAETVPLSVNDRIPALEKGDVDLITNLTIKDERKEKVDFCDPYAADYTAILTPNDKPLTSEEQVNEATIGVIKDTNYVMSMKSVFPKAKLIEYNSYDEFYKALEDGKVDGVCANSSILNRLANRNKGYYLSVLLSSSSYVEYAAPAVAKGNVTLKEAANMEIKRMLEANEFAAIAETVSANYLYTLDTFFKSVNELGINLDAKPKDGTYQSNDGYMTMIVKGDTAIFYNEFAELTLEEYTNNMFELLKKVKAA